MTLEVDYVVVGAGAMGMAFTDVLLTETNATIALVERRAKPGGHWNDAYPFVRLHQPSAFYGVNSTPLGSGRIDSHGWNAGLAELASGSEVVAYFDQVLNHRFLPSERVHYLPSTEYVGGVATSLVSGAATVIDATTVVDASYMNVTVPATRPPDYDVADDVTCVPVGEMPRHVAGFERYVIIGAGKTGMDACLWLLGHGADPDTITWIMPRDSWMLNRANIQPPVEFFEDFVGAQAGQAEIVATSSSRAEAIERLADAGLLLRLDDEVEPTMYRCATVTEAELDQLRRIDDVVRLGRVHAIETDQVALDRGTFPTGPEVLHVDCTADGLERRPVRPVFDDGRITLQTVRTCQQVFSAAFIAHVEAAYDGDDAKNDLCGVVPHPDSIDDWFRSSLGSSRKSTKWRTDEALSVWLATARLDAFGPAAAAVGEDPDRLALVMRLFEHSPAQAANLERFVAELDGV